MIEVENKLMLMSFMLVKVRQLNYCHHKLVMYNHERIYIFNYHLN